MADKFAVVICCLLARCRCHYFFSSGLLRSRPIHTIQFDIYSLDGAYHIFSALVYSGVDRSIQFSSTFTRYMEQTKFLQHWFTQEQIDPCNLVRHLQARWSIPHFFSIGLLRSRTIHTIQFDIYSIDGAYHISSALVYSGVDRSIQFSSTFTRSVPHAIISFNVKYTKS